MLQAVRPHQRPWLAWTQGLDIVLTMCQHNVRSAQTGFAQAVGKLPQGQPQALGGA
jgi:hypothetical protein